MEGGLAAGEVLELGADVHRRGALPSPRRALADERVAPVHVPEDLPERSRAETGWKGDKEHP